MKRASYCQLNSDFNLGPNGRTRKVNQRCGTLLVPVPGISGTMYPPGTPVAISGRGSSVDAFVDGDWLPLAWWEFAEGLSEGVPDS